MISRSIGSWPRVVANSAMLMAVACGNAFAERIELPAPLSALLQASSFVETGGMRYSNFALGLLMDETTGDGVQQSQRTVVNAVSNNGFSGLDFQIRDEGYSASGPSQIRQWRVVFDVEPLPNGGSISLVRLAANATASGNGVAIVDSSIHDNEGPNRELPFSLEVSTDRMASDGGTFLSAGGSSTLVSASVGMSLLAWPMDSAANIKSVTLRVRNSAQAPNVGDYDYDDDVDGADFLVWQRQFGASRSLDADGNFDGKVNAADYAIWRDNFGTQIGPPGDFDGDGDVDGADFLTWQRAFGSSDPAVDANKNGVVDAADYTIWRNNFGTGVAGSDEAVTTVPEPSTQMLLLFAGIAASLLVVRASRR